MTTNYRQERQLGIVLAWIASLIALWPLLDDYSISWGWYLAAITFALLSWQAPGLLTPLLKLWLRIGHVLGIFNTHLLLGIAFYLLITPLAIIFKLMGRDALNLHGNKMASFWQRHEKKWSPNSFRRQF